MEEGAKIEKLERMSEDIARQMKGMQKILENVKSMENLVSVSREIEEKLSRIEDLKAGTERDAEKSEKTYLEMERRMQELIQVRESVRKLDELTRELVKSVDEEKIKIAGLVGKEDLQKALDAALKPPNVGKTQEDKANEKREIESLLKNLETQYKKGLISKESFEEVSEKNKVLAQKMDAEIKDYDASKNPQTLAEWMQSVENELNSVEMKLSIAETGNGMRQNIRQAKEIKTDSPGFPKMAEMNDIRSLLSELEDQYREGQITESAYEEMAERNRKKLEKIEASSKTGMIPERNGAAKKISSLLAELEK